MSQKTTQKLKEAIAQRDEQPKPPSLPEVLNKTITDQAPAFGVLLPKGAEREKFELQLVTAIKATPALMDCLRTTQGKVSLILAARQAAALGLEVNTLLHEASLEPRKQKGVQECRLNIEWRGFVKLAEDATGGKVDAEVVREGDEFRYGYALAEDFLDHVPSGDEDSAKTHVWARLRYPDGRAQFVVMGKQAVEKRRAMSDSWRKYGKDSIWGKWEDEQWKKTAVRTLCKRIRLSPTVAQALASDEAALQVDNSKDEPEIVAFHEEQPDEVEGAADAEVVAASEDETSDDTPDELPVPEASADDVDGDPGRPFA